MGLPGVRIGCWNVNSLRVRWPLVQTWLKEEKIDIALVQETKVTDDLFPKNMVAQEGYHCVFWGQKAYNGVAIMSRWPLDHVMRCDFNHTGAARYIQATTNGMRLASVYVPQGQGFDKPAYGEKMAFLRGLAQHMAPYVWDCVPTIMGGDYNIAPQDEDVHDPVLWRDRLMCSMEERQAFRSIRAMGWVEAQITQKGKSNPHTWWHYRHGAWAKKQGLRIDSFLLSPYAADFLCQSGVSSYWRDAPQTSDHCPLWMDLLLG
jgi:exodeoxyribonuclease-3